MPPPNRHFSLSAKMNDTQRRTLVRPLRMHCVYCGMPKGISRAEAISNSEKIMPIALGITGLKTSGGQVVSLSVSRKFHWIFLKFCSNLLKVIWVDLKACLGLINTAQLSSGKVETNFWVNLLVSRPHTFIPIVILVARFVWGPYKCYKLLLVDQFAYYYIRLLHTLTIAALSSSTYPCSHQHTFYSPYCHIDTSGMADLVNNYSYLQVLHVYCFSQL